MSAPVIIAIAAGASLGVTLVVLLIRGSFQLGKLVNKVDNQEIRIDNLVAKVGDLETTVDTRFKEMEAKFGTKLSEMEAEFATRFREIDTRFREMEAKFDTRLNEMEAKFDTRLNEMEAKFDARLNEMEAKTEARFDALTAAINELRDEVRQTNKILVGLANHTHDADGRTVFTIPT